MGLFEYMCTVAFHYVLFERILCLEYPAAPNTDVTRTHDGCEYVHFILFPDDILWINRFRCMGNDHPLAKYGKTFAELTEWTCNGHVRTAPQQLAAILFIHAYCLQ